MLLGKRFYYLTGVTAIVLMVVLCAFVKNSAEGDSFELAQRGIMLRNVGHQLLLQSGDSTSRVLPVKQIAENEYQIQFEKQFTFKHASLIAIVKKALASSKHPADYIVNVVGCSTPGVLFGYAVLDNGKANITPCSGRRQPVGCYKVNIIFKDRDKPINQGYLVAGLPLLAFIGLLLFRPKQAAKASVADGAETVLDKAITIGNMLLDTEQHCLVHAGQTIALTTKEYKLLYIFAQSANEIIPRGKLQKEIWEDEGVIVGRSLDMFISRLRKKLEADQSVKLVNIHGKGFKLETE